MSKVLDLNINQLKEINGGDAPFDSQAIVEVAQSGNIPLTAHLDPTDQGTYGKALHLFVKGGP